MGTTDTAVLIVSVAALVLGLLSLMRFRNSRWFGSEATRLRLRKPHIFAMVGAVAAIVMISIEGFGLEVQPILRLRDQPDNFLSLATVLVLFMLFGFIAFEAGTVPEAYRNRSTEKNLLVVVFSLGSYFLVGRFVYDFVAGESTVGFGDNQFQMGIVFQAGFACTVSLIVANAITERASAYMNILCAVFAAGVGYPAAAGLAWGTLGTLHELGFIDASGAGVVHLLGASIALFAAAFVGPRVRLQRNRFLGWPDTPDFRSPWSVVGGFFLMFGWLGFNSGNAEPALRGHAFFNTMIGATCGGFAAWALSRGALVLQRWPRDASAHRPVGSERSFIETLASRRRIVIGMMAGLVAVTANGALKEVLPWMAAGESLVAGLLAVFVSTWITHKPGENRIDDPLGVIGTHGFASVVGILSTAFWCSSDVASFLAQFTVQLIGCGVCVVLGWGVAIIPCLFLLSTERWAIAEKKSSRFAARLRLRIGAIEQLGIGTPRQVPRDDEWTDKVREANFFLRLKCETPGWWEAARTCAAATDVLDMSSRSEFAKRIMYALEEFPSTIDDPENEVIALAVLCGTVEYAGPDKIRLALAKCLERAKRDGNGHPHSIADKCAQARVWSVGVLTERAIIVSNAAGSAMLTEAEESFQHLRELDMADKGSPGVLDLARTARIDSNARLLTARGNRRAPAPSAHATANFVGPTEVSMRLSSDESPASRQLGEQPPHIVESPGEDTTNRLFDRMVDVVPGQEAVDLSGSEILPIDSPLFNFEIRDSVARLTADSSVEACVGAVQRGDVNEVFIDTEDGPVSQAILDLAETIHRRIAKSFRLFEPVVVGPVSDEDYQTCERLARMHIRTTGQSFERYLNDMGAVRDFMRDRDR